MKTSKLILTIAAFSILPHLGKAANLPSENDPDPSELVASAYSTATLLQRSLQDAQSIAIGPRILYFEQQIDRIVKISGQNPTEEAVRLTLLRSQHLGRGLSTYLGQNTGLLAQWLANFYKDSFQLALMYANNPCGVISSQNPVGEYLRNVSIAQYGFTYSSLLWRNQSNMIADPAKAAILISMVQNLLHDTNVDLHRNQPSMKEVIADLYYLTQDGVYLGVRSSLQHGDIPSNSDLTQLRSKVYRIWTELPQKLSQAGISPQPI